MVVFLGISQGVFTWLYVCLHCDFPNKNCSCSQEWNHSSRQLLTFSTFRQHREGCLKQALFTTILATDDIHRESRGWVLASVYFLFSFCSYGWNDQSFDSMLEEELDAAKRDGTCTARVSLDILEVEEVLGEFFLGDQIGRFVIVLGQLARGLQLDFLSSLR
jgi:hypothetical protein